MGAPPPVKPQMPLASTGSKGGLPRDAAGCEVVFEHVAAPAREAFGIPKAGNEVSGGQGMPGGQEAGRHVIGWAPGTGRAAVEEARGLFPESSSKVDSAPRAELLDTARDEDAVPPYPGLAEQNSVVALLAERAKALDAVDETRGGASVGRAPPANVSPIDEDLSTTRPVTPLPAEELVGRGVLFSPSKQTALSGTRAGVSLGLSPSKGQHADEHAGAHALFLPSMGGRLRDSPDLPHQPLRAVDASSSAFLDGSVPSSGCALQSLCRLWHMLQTVKSLDHLTIEPPGAVVDKAKQPCLSP